MHGASESLPSRALHLAVAPVSDGVDAPLVHALDGEVEGSLLIVGSKAPFQVPQGIVGRTPATAAVGVDEAFGRQLLQHVHALVQVLHTSSCAHVDATCTHTEEKTAVRVHQPPSSVHLLLGEEARACGAMGLVASPCVIAIEAVRLHHLVLLFTPFALQCLERSHLTVPFHQIALSQLVEGRLLAQIGIARVLGIQLYVAHLHRGIAEGHVLAQANAVHSRHGTHITSYVHPSRLPGLVVHSCHIHRTGRRL